MKLLDKSAKIARKVHVAKMHKLFSHYCILILHACIFLNKFKLIMIQIFLQWTYKNILLFTYFVTIIRGYNFIVLCDWLILNWSISDKKMSIFAEVSLAPPIEVFQLSRDFQV